MCIRDSIDAARILRDRGGEPRARFLIVGGGREDEEAAIRAHYAKDPTGTVEFAGVRRGEEKIDAFRQANAEWAHAQQRTPSG